MKRHDRTDEAARVFMQLQSWLEASFPELDGRVIITALLMQVGYMIAINCHLEGSSAADQEVTVKEVDRIVRDHVESLRKEWTQ